MPGGNQNNQKNKKQNPKAMDPRGQGGSCVWGFGFFCFFGFSYTFLVFSQNSIEMYVFLKFLCFSMEFIKNHGFPQDFPHSTHIMRGLRESYVNFHIPRRLDVVCGRVFHVISISTFHADALESNAVFVSPKYLKFQKDAAASFTSSKSIL